MLIEDDATMMSLLNTLLDLEGFDTVLSSGDSAESFASSVIQELPDALLLDVHLRHVNGLDILKAVRSTPAGHNVKIIMTSGMNVGDDCLKFGADGFLLKPYIPDELINWLRANCS